MILYSSIETLSLTGPKISDATDHESPLSHHASEYCSVSRHLHGYGYIWWVCEGTVWVWQTYGYTPACGYFHLKKEGVAASIASVFTSVMTHYNWSCEITVSYHMVSWESDFVLVSQVVVLTPGYNTTP